MAKKAATTTETDSSTEQPEVKPPLARKKGDVLEQRVVDPETGRTKTIKCKVIKDVRQKT